MGYDIIQASKLTPNICHVHVLTRAGLAALYLKKFKKIPYVITEHWSRYFPHNDHFTNPFHKWVTRKIVRNASAMTTVSDTLRKAMQQKGIQHPDWSLLPNVIDVNRFTPVDKMHNSQHTKILHVSCFEDKSKNISGMLRAYAKSLTHSPNMELVLVGDGPDFEELKAYSKELGIRDQQIRFTGVLQKQALIDQMNDCDFSMLFSNYETFGIVVLESIALGKPVIASNAGALPEVLPSNCGMLVEKGDEEALCKAILKMAQEYAHYDVDEMHAFVAEHYDTKVIGYQLINLYKKHINNA